MARLDPNIKNNKSKGRCQHARTQYDFGNSLWHPDKLNIIHYEIAFIHPLNVFSRIIV